MKQAGHCHGSPFQPSAIEPTREIHLHVSVTSDQLVAILRH
jgi:hypothetical protein